MYGIEFQFELENTPIPEARMRAAISAALDREETAPDSALTVVVTGDEQVRSTGSSAKWMRRPISYRFRRNRCRTCLRSWPI
jgi:uncharacterized alpha/beta hydrolase family protein